ncbi:MAG: hypothetical protein RL226_984 [Bacteroidota bacterium]
MPSTIEFLDFLPALLRDEVLQASTEVEVKAGEEILREGQYVKVVPLVIEGLIKVFTRYDDRDLLLYYIQPADSCVMSFSAGYNNEPSKVFAVTELDTRALLMPTSKLGEWTKKYPEMNALFFQQYNRRYNEMVDTLNHLLFEKMDRRLLNYLHEKVDVTGANPLKLSHRQIAGELGTAREVISRVMKKLENEGRVIQLPNGIEICER